MQRGDDLEIGHKVGVHQKEDFRKILSEAHKKEEVKCIYTLGINWQQTHRLAYTNASYKKTKN